MNNSIIILDYGFGNIYSIKSALKKIDLESQSTRDFKKILAAKLIILPGVGSFKQAMQAIKNYKLDLAIKEAMKNKAKILGICLGYQMLFEESEEFGITTGLGIIKGKVVSLNKFIKNSAFINFAGNLIHASIHSSNVVGFQYHPEKSGLVGLTILRDTIGNLLKG